MVVNVVVLDFVLFQQVSQVVDQLMVELRIFEVNLKLYQDRHSENQNLPLINRVSQQHTLAQQEVVVDFALQHIHTLRLCSRKSRSLKSSSPDTYRCLRNSWELKLALAFRVRY